MLKARVITALVLLPLVLGILFGLPAWCWNLFACFSLTLAAWEWGRLARFDRIESSCFIVTFVLLGIAWLYLPLARAWDMSIDIFSLAFWGVLAPLWLKFKRPLAPKWHAALLGWLLLLAALAGVCRVRELPLPGVPGGGAMALLLILAIAWIADIAAYFTGRAWGRHKLAPTISPGKSWEGVFGGLVAVGLYLGVLKAAAVPIFSSLPWGLLFLLGILLTGVSIVGDLFESLLKRQVGMKDSSQLLPGHGGVLDRIDSLVALIPFVVAMAFGYLRWGA